MDGARRWLAVAGFVVLLVSIASLPVAGAPSEAGAGADTSETVQRSSTANVTSERHGALVDDGRPPAQLATDSTISLTQTYNLTEDDPGSVSVRLAYAIPDRVRSLETTLPENATVVRTDGFDRVNGTTYEWDGESTSPSVTYRRNPNETLQDAGPEGADGEYVGVDAGEWALFTRSGTPTEWTYVGADPVAFERTMRTAGPGATGEWLVYLGAVETTERTTNGQTIRLAVPERATMAESPSAILASLSNGSDALRIGDRDEEVFVLAAPSGSVSWGARGYQIGDADMWVRDSEELDTAENIWLHEYVHSRQTFRSTRETRWLLEGSAVYYAAALTLEQDHIDFATFRSRLGAGTSPEYEDVVLADPDSWRGDGNYYRGPLVAGRVDEAIRLATDDERTLQDTLRQLNGASEPVTQAQWLATVERASDGNVSTLAAEYTETPAAVEMWNESRHAAVFGQLPARIGYRLPDADDPTGYRISGPYRTESVSDPPVELAVGERLTVGAVVSNAGGTEGRYNATLAINGTGVETATGRIEPGTNRTVNLSHTFATPGRYTLSIDGETVTVVVERPARTRVTALDVSSRTAQVGESVVVTATVTNDADVPAEGLVVFTRNFESVTEQEVVVGPQNATRLSATVPLTEPGNVSLSAGGAEPVTVRVGPGSTTTPTATTTADGPGFTAVVALVAVVLCGLAALRR